MLSSQNKNAIKKALSQVTGMTRIENKAPICSYQFAVNFYEMRTLYDNLETVVKSRKK